MTEKDVVTPKRKQLREEAADWFALMRGPDADAQRPGLEAWLAKDALHRAAYNQIAETFSLGKGLKPAVGAPNQEDVRQSPALPSPRSPRRLVMAGGFAAMLIGAVSIGLYRSPTTGPTASTGAASALGPHAAVRLETGTGGARSFTLSDGSSVDLRADSLVLVRFAGERRDLELLRGRARFTVAHDGRPFTVVAAGGSVTARGTVFDVALDSRQGVVVHLIQGRVDVAMPNAPQSQGAMSNAAVGPVRHLVAGELFGFGPGAFAAEARVSEAGRDAEQLHDIDRMRLGDLLAQANRVAAIPILLETADLAELRISGTFRIADSRKLAENLGIPLGLAVIDRGDVIALAHSCPTKNEGHCRPPS